MIPPAEQGARRNWREETIPPAEMLTKDIRAELRHCLDVYGQLRHPLSVSAMAGRINVLVEEMGKREVPGWIDRWPYRKSAAAREAGT